MLQFKLHLSFNKDLTLDELKVNILQETSRSSAITAAKPSPITATWSGTLVLTLENDPSSAIFVVSIEYIVFTLGMTLT